ncbi:MAG TPA: amidase [Alphaproteobacteria bacterium]|nr:amidase [Alphaproteobacteria bacterium]
MTTVELGALVPHGRIRVAGAATGPLAGLTFMAKDLFDVAGHGTSAGNPDWLATHQPATAHAWAVQALLDAGATLTGKTITDELAYGLTGRNFHYGAPINPAAPDRITGGSSSGSVAVVAGGLADFALGSDTGGSVRIPASYCGVFGLRPTHGRVPTTGVVDLAPSFDTVGWFARDAGLMERIGRVLLREEPAGASASRLIIAEDLFALADKDLVAALEPSIARAKALINENAAARVFRSDPAEWREAFRLLQAREAWQSDGAWITRHRPKLGPDVQERFDIASKVTDADLLGPRRLREQVAAVMAELLADGAVLCLPTSPVPAPKRDASFETLGDVRMRTMAFTCVAGLARLPQISIPAGAVGGAPVGLSFIAARGGDMMLLALARAIAG